MFEQLTVAEDYYVGRVETEIHERQAEAIAERIADGSMIVDLGCGNANKIRPILQKLDYLGRYRDYHALGLLLSEIERTLDALASSCTFSWQSVHFHGLLGTGDDARRLLHVFDNLWRPTCLVNLGIRRQGT